MIPGKVCFKTLHTIGMVCNPVLRSFPGNRVNGAPGYYPAVLL